jgi:hypothetical protein
VITTPTSTPTTATSTATPKPDDLGDIPEQFVPRDLDAKKAERGKREGEVGCWSAKVILVDPRLLLTLGDRDSPLRVMKLRRVALCGIPVLDDIGVCFFMFIYFGRLGQVSIIGISTGTAVKVLFGWRVVGVDEVPFVAGHVFVLTRWYVWIYH